MSMSMMNLPAYSTPLPDRKGYDTDGTIERIALAGYAAAHAPTTEQAHVAGTLALKVRTFDRRNGQPDWPQGLPYVLQRP